MEEFLRSQSLKDIGEMRMISLKETETLKNTLKIFAKNHISAAPVLDDEGWAFGSVDMLDLVSYTASKMNPDKPWVFNEGKAKEYLDMEVIRIMDISGRNAWHSIPSTKSLSRALPFLCHPHIHRVFLTNEIGQCVGVLSQSKLVEFLWRHNTALDKRLSFKVQELFPESRPVKTIFCKDRLVDAFKRIQMDRVSGIAVVDEKGALCGNISASDLKFTSIDDPSQLLKNICEDTIYDCLCKTNEQKQKQVFSGELPHLEPVIVELNDTLKNVMQKMCNNRVHRVYVVDNDRKPIKVISLSDVIGQFSK